MGAMRSRGILAALLALLLATAGPPGGGRAAEGVPPDLEIKYVGRNPANGAELMFRVTNVGKWWVDATEATVETVVGPRNPSLTVRVPDLGPKGDPDTASEFEFPYEAICSQGGLKLKASLKKAMDWAGDEETNTANNTWEDWICQPYQGRQPPAQPAPVPAANEPVPVSLSPSVVKSLRASQSYRQIVPDTPRFISLNADPLVGWGQNENKALLGADNVWISQTAVKFDLSQVQPGFVLPTATLSFREDASQWTNGAGQNVQKAGCVARIGAATTDWAGAVNIVTLFQNELIDSSPPGRKEWNVTHQVQLMLNNPQDPSLHRGFVLMGEKNLGDLEGEDDTRCESKLSEISLKFRVAPRLGR